MKNILLVDQSSVRLLIKLRCIESSEYELQYHYHLQGFIYNLLKGSKYHYIHNKKGFKFFCFSNIFPATKNLEKNDLRTLIISSPADEFIEYFCKVLLQYSESPQVKVGTMRFKIDSVDRLAVKIPRNSSFTLITGTPIIVRIPRGKYDSYISKSIKNYDYIYWRSDHPIELFISQVENNLSKKYTQYVMSSSNSNSIEGKKVMSELPLSLFSFFQKFKFKKQISTRVLMKGFDQVVIGTMWEFGFNMDANRDVIQFALDSGLGERNSLGFGFMNIITNK